VNRAIRMAAVVVPAHDEEDLLPGCLAALDVARLRSPVPVRIVVVLDDCRDGSIGVCQGYPVETLAIADRNVGAARAAGSRHALRHHTAPTSLWLAHTDADSRVGPSWIADQLEIAASADAVVGVVHLSEAAPSADTFHRTHYLSAVRADGTHDHVHGANLGVRASAYLRAGGFLPLPAHEDRQLVSRLEGTVGVKVVRSSRVSVETSARRGARCAEGFGATLARRDAELARSDTAVLTRAGAESHRAGSGSPPNDTPEETAA
jgi:glycosyltransferase involved in cell wall biosynthesis